MFGNFRGSQTLEVIDQGGLNPLFWGATIERDTSSIYLKVSRHDRPYQTTSPALHPRTSNDLTSCRHHPFSSRTRDADTVRQVINIGNKTVPLDISFDASYTKVNGTILRNDDPNAFNWINNQTAVVPQALGANASALSSVGSNGTFTWTVPTWSITVLQFDQ
jgi:hypothetical protein